MSSLDSGRTSHHIRSTSSHQRIVPEHQSVIAAQDQCQSFRCNPVTNPDACPKTARVYLEGLEQTLKNQKIWISWGTQLHDIDSLADFPISTEPFEGSTRDKLLAITQSFLHKALEMHPAVTKYTIKAWHPNVTFCSFHHPSASQCFGVFSPSIRLQLRTLLSIDPSRDIKNE